MGTKTTTAGSSRSALTAAVQVVPVLLDLPGQVCTVRLRGESVTVIAELNDPGDELGAGQRDPITDVLTLELASGSGQNTNWPRPVAIHAVVVTGRNPVRAVQRASRWASYAARVAIVPADRVSDHALAEASLRGVWLVAVEPDTQPQIVSPGEAGATPGAVRGLLHRLLDEVVLQAVIRQHQASAKPA